MTYSYFRSHFKNFFRFLLCFKFKSQFNDDRKSCALDFYILEWNFLVFSHTLRVSFHSLRFFLLLFFHPEFFCIIICLTDKRIALSKQNDILRLNFHKNSLFFFSHLPFLPKTFFNGIRWRKSSEIKILWNEALNRYINSIQN